MIRSFAVFVGLASGLLVGCAAADGSSESVDGNQAEVTSLHWYDCNGPADLEDKMKRLEVGMSASTMRVIDLSKDAAPPDTGKFDPTYRPTPAFAGMIRYKSFDVLGTIFDEVSDFAFIVSKEIQNNAAQGKIFNRTSGPEGGGTSSYFCRSKDKPMSVDTSKRARFACNLKLTCTHDNPPGDTCLDSAFINQNTANGATLKTKFLDHFGVHVQEREVNVGASSSMHRTAGGFEAQWEGHKLELKYRAGVTYTGKLTLPDGRTSDAQCNDLAMFD